RSAKPEAAETAQSDIAPSEEASHADATVYAPVYAPGDRSWIMRFDVILLAVMWAYNGWSGFTPVSEEIRDPQRNIPLALLAGMGIVMALYVSANVAYHGVLSMNELATEGERGAHAVAERLAHHHWGAVAISAIIM